MFWKLCGLLAGFALFSYFKLGITVQDLVFLRWHYRLFLEGPDQMQILIFSFLTKMYWPRSLIELLLSPLWQYQFKCLGGWLDIYIIKLASEVVVTGNNKERGMGWYLYVKSSLNGFFYFYKLHSVHLQGLITRERKCIDPAAVPFAKSQGETGKLGLWEGSSLLEVVSLFWKFSYLYIG